MGQGISEVLPFAIGIAISPVPIIAVILILFSTRARVNGPAFLLGWVVGIAGVALEPRAWGRGPSWPFCGRYQPLLEPEITCEMA